MIAGLRQMLPPESRPGGPGRTENGRPPQETGHPTNPLPGYSHSMVPGGLLVTSSTTRFTPSTSLVMRLEILASRS